MGKRNSVVIKVGMVGDAQIGKTSLMVKYVEGSFDEDYIQTLGMTPPSLRYRAHGGSGDHVLIAGYRSEFHGENHIYP